MMVKNTSAQRMADGSESESKINLDKLTLNPHNQIMKNKNTTLNFNNVCAIRTYLAIAIQSEVKAHKNIKANWGVNSYFTKSSRNRISDMITAYRASKNITIVS